VEDLKYLGFEIRKGKFGNSWQTNMRVYPKVSRLASWNKNSK
jgi:hypothetical protein